MKHLNEFEEFDPKDFEDFEQDIKDLKSLGFPIPTLGIDYGFGPDLSGKNDGKTPLYINQNCIDFLENKKFIRLDNTPPGFSINQDVYNLFRSKLKTDEMWNFFNKFTNLEFPRIHQRDFGYRYTLPKNEKKEMRTVLLKDVFTSRYFPVGQYRGDKPHPINFKTVKMIYGFLVEILENKI
jgi:hypothetical protein